MAGRGRAVSRIPEFKSQEEEAEFWDSHDLSDDWDQFKRIKVRLAKNLSEGMTIRFDPETLLELRKRAKRKGMGPTTLVRMWVMERLEGEHRLSGDDCLQRDHPYWQS